MSLPVGLAIALLEDSDGLIELDVPVKGDMDQPQFELGGSYLENVRKCYHKYCYCTI